jgi:adenine-specific DNA-methyltransferase
MEKLKMQSPDLIDKNIEKISKLFPNVITEIKDEEGNPKKAIDFDLLKQSLSDVLVKDEDERYRLDWPGKKASLLKANTPINKTLRPVVEDSVNFENTENVFIEGDNFEVLKILQESYLGRVKMIYIDPPYNTGKDFIYMDNFKVSKEEYEEEIGAVDEYGDKLFKNTDSNGRFHSDWLSMMYERLVVARDLLKEDGVIFISIDDNEVHNLKKICDEIFGEENFVNLISLNAKVSAGASGGGEDRKLKKNIEYILVYCRAYEFWEPITPIYKETKLIDYIQQMKKDNKSFKYTNVIYKCEDINYYSTIKAGNNEDIIISKVDNYEIKTVKQIAQIENISEENVYQKYFDKIMTTTNAQTSIRDRVWKETGNDNDMYIAEYIPKSGKNKGKKTQIYFMGKQKVLVIWLKDTAVKIGKEIFKREKVGTFWDGFSWINVTKEGSIKFQNGKKPIALIQQLMRMIPHNNNMIVMDFFAGSATTAHAVMQYNSDDGGSRKYIMAQLPETIEANTKDNKDYLKYLEEENIAPIVTEISKERIRRAGNKIVADNKGKEGIEKLDIGFRVYKIVSTNLKDVYYHPEELGQKLLPGIESNIKEDRTPDDLLTQVILDLGLELNLPIEKKNILGNTVFIVQTNALIACFDNNINFKIVDEIAELKPFKVVFKDASFKDDKDRINVEERFKRLSPETIIAVI